MGEVSIGRRIGNRTFDMRILGHMVQLSIVPLSGAQSSADHWQLHLLVDKAETFRFFSKFFTCPSSTLEVLEQVLADSCVILVFSVMFLEWIRRLSTLKFVSPSSPRWFATPSNKGS